MIWFKTRHEVKELRREVAFLTDMLKTHLNIKYTLEDFAKWDDLHLHTSYIRVTEGERIHYLEMLLQVGVKLEAKNVEDVYPIYRGKTLHTVEESFDNFMDKVEQTLLRIQQPPKPATPTESLKDYKDLESNNPKSKHKNRNRGKK